MGFKRAEFILVIPLLIGLTLSFHPSIQPAKASSLVTATPQPDGSVYHTVGTGETLWDISQAYDVPVARLMLLNGFTEETSTIFTGQKILVRMPPAAVTVTVAGFHTETPTPDDMEILPTATSTLQPPTPTEKIIQTPTPDAARVEAQQRLKQALTVTSIVGAVLVILFILAFRRPTRYE